MLAGQCAGDVGPMRIAQWSDNVPRGSYRIRPAWGCHPYTCGMSTVAFSRPMVDSRAVLYAAIASVVALIIVYRQTVGAMVDLWWRFDAYQHGFAVLPIVIWLIWNRRQELPHASFQPSVAGLIALAGAGFLWLLGVIAHAGVVTHFAIVLMIIAVVPAVAGWRVARRLAFPLGFLFFAVPFGEFMVPTLMDWTADFTVTALRATGVPVFREGNDFVIPTGRWSVVEECSGIRYFHAALMGGALFAYLVYRRPTRRIAFIAFSIVAPIIANWLRAYLTVLLGHLTNNRLASGVDHLLYGWLFFGVVIFAIFWVGIRWREDIETPAANSEAPGPHRARPVSRSTLVAMTGALIAIGVVWLPIAQGIQERLDAFVPDFSNERISAREWQRADAAAPSWKPVLPGARSESRQVFVRGGDRAGVHIAWFYGKEEGAKLVSSQNVMVNRNSGWRIVERGGATIPWRGATRSVTKSVLSNGVERLEVHAFYWVAGWSTSNDFVASAMLAVSKLVLLRSDAAMVLIFAATRPDGTSPLDGFVADVSTSIDGGLSQAGRGPVRN